MHRAQFPEVPPANDSGPICAACGARVGSEGCACELGGQVANAGPYADIETALRASVELTRGRVR